MPQKVYSIRIMLDMLSNRRLYRKMNEDSWKMLCEDMCRCAATSTSTSNDLDVNFIKEKCMNTLKLRFINQFAACILVLYLSEIYPEHCESLLMLFYDMLIGSKSSEAELSEIVRTSRCWFRQVFVRQTHEFWCKISKIEPETRP